MASASTGIDSLLGIIAQRLGFRVSPRARPCLRAWSIQMDCSVCRSACGLTRRETSPASAEGWRASWSVVARVGSNGRRVQVTRAGTRATACKPATLTHDMLAWCTTSDDVWRFERDYFTSDFLTKNKNRHKLDSSVYAVAERRLDQPNLFLRVHGAVPGRGGRGGRPARVPQLVKRPGDLFLFEQRLEPRGDVGKRACSRRGKQSHVKW